MLGGARCGVANNELDQLAEMWGSSRTEVHVEYNKTFHLVLICMRCVPREASRICRVSHQPTPACLSGEKLR
jgi:hypothetical protein